MVTAIPSVHPTQADFTHRGLVTAAVTSVVNILLLTFVFGVGLVEPFAPLSYPPVVLLPTAGTVAATLVYELLTDHVTDMDRTFFKVAVVVLVTSFLLDIGLPYADPGATMSGVLVLMLMHVVVAAVCVTSFIGLGWGVPKGTDRTGPESDRATAVRALFRIS